MTDLAAHGIDLPAGNDTYNSIGDSSSATSDGSPSAATRST
jgi:hypothetical protein